MIKLDEKQTALMSEWARKNDEEWLKDHPTFNVGAIGGRYTFSFTPTSLGMVIEVTDNLVNNSLDLTDYDAW